MRGTRCWTGAVASAPQQWWLPCDMRRGSGVGSCSLPLLGSGGLDRADPHTDNTLHCAHTMVEVAGPPVCGCGTTANVGKRRAPWGGPNAGAAGPRGGGQGCKGGELGGMGVGWQGDGWKIRKKQRRGQGKSRVREEGRKQGWECIGRCKGNAGEMHGRRTGDARRTPWALAAT